MNFKRKIRYFLSSLKKRILMMPSPCPSCGCCESYIVSRKYLITDLRRCRDCMLLFRSPITTQKENWLYYNNEYEQGFTTEMPSDELLDKLKLDGFSGSERDYGKYLEIIKALNINDGAEIFDFGCSWGYGSFQMSMAGYNVTSYEISESRREYARRKLNVNTISNFDICNVDQDLKGKFDVFFSAHVLEHVPSPSAVFKAAMEILKPGGIFIAITPNGSAEYRACQPSSWMKLWGEVHPNFLDKEYWLNLAGNYQGYVLGSIPIAENKLRDFCNCSKFSYIGDMDRIELVFIVRR